MATPTSLSALARQHEADMRIQSSLSSRLQDNKQVMTFGQIVALKVIRQSGISNKRLCALIQGWGYKFTPPLTSNQMPTANHTVSVAVARTAASQHDSEKLIKASLSARLDKGQTMTMGHIATLKAVRESGSTVPRLCALIRSWGYAFSPPLAANEMPQASHFVAMSAAKATTTPSAPDICDEFEQRIKASLSSRLKDNGLVLTFGKIAALKVVRQSEISDQRLCELIRSWGYVFTPPLAAKAMPTDSHTVAVPGAKTTITKTPVFLKAMDSVAGTPPLAANAMPKDSHTVAVPGAKTTLTKTPVFLKAMDNLAGKVRTSVPNVSVIPVISPAAEPTMPDEDPFAELSINSPYIREWLANPTPKSRPSLHNLTQLTLTVAAMHLRVNLKRNLTLDAEFRKRRAM
ncbi:hypothetical protein HDU88_008886 [Geranomyces variabilis]|nr:hypothetical protein HDU88_008886 [Geranomyces variabilis]